MNDTAERIRILLVDDQELVRAGLRGILRARDGFHVVGECSHGGEVPGAIAALRPDVVLMDVRMPSSTGSRRRAAYARLRMRRRCSP